MTDLVSGQVDLLVVQGAVSLPQVRAGTIKAIANLSPQRSASMPDIPTSDEGGVPGFLYVGMVRLLRAEGHAEGAIAKLNGAMVRCSPIRRCKARFAELGLDVASPRAADARGPRGIPEGRDREMVADHPAAGVKAE